MKGTQKGTLKMGWSQKEEFFFISITFLRVQKIFVDYQVTFMLKVTVIFFN